MRIVWADNTMVYDDRTPENEPLGGSQSSLVYITRGLAKLGHDVIVYNRQPEGPGVWNGVTYLPIKNMHKVNDQRADVFISNRDPRLYQGWQGSGKRIVRLQDDWGQPLIELFVYAKLRVNIDHCFFNSEYQRKSLYRHMAWPRSRTTVIPSCFYGPLFPKEFPEPVGNRLVYSSTPFRGLDELLDIFPAIREQVSDAELHVYSDMKIYQYDDERDQKRCGEIYAKLDQPGVIYHGSMGQRDLAMELSKCKVWAYPNTFPETSCVAQMEAQAAGCVVVTSRLGALPETVGPHGVLIDGHASEAGYQKRFVHECVNLLKNEDLWRGKAKNAREWIFSHNNSEDLAKVWEVEIEKVLRKKKGNIW